ncbi:MAG: hypothetical protein ACRDN6_00260 [Gaiellaceae bacterium]
MLIGGSGAAPLAPGDDFQIVSSKFEGTTATFVVTNSGTTNLAVFQATFPAETRVVGASSSPSAGICAGGGSLPNAGACIFTEMAPWPPGSTRTITFQLAAPAPDGQVVRLCATSQFGGSDVCEDVVVRTEKPCKCRDIVLKPVPVIVRTSEYSATNLKYELRWELTCEGGPGACAGEIRVSLRKRPLFFQDAKLRRPKLDVICKGNCTAKDAGIHRVRSGPLLFEIVAKESLKPSYRKNKTMVVRFRTFCAGDNKPRSTFDLLFKFDEKNGDVDSIKLREM